LIAGSFVRLRCPEHAKIEDKQLAEELGISTYLLLSPRLDRVVELLQEMSESIAERRSGAGRFCPVLSLCFALGTRVKDRAGNEYPEALRRISDGDQAPTQWQWGDIDTLERLAQEVSPKATAYLV